MQLTPYLLEVADVVNTTLDLETLFQRVAELVRRVIDYKIFSILLLNEKTQELRMRFQIGHSAEAERLRVRVGNGVVGKAAEERKTLLVDDVAAFPGYINAHPDARSELAIPLIIKNRVIGVLDLQATSRGYFTEEHSRLLELIASRIAIGVENARLYTRVARQAQTLTLLNEISREITSILQLDELFKRIGELLTRVIDYQMFSILLLDATGKVLQHRFSLRFNENIHLKHDIQMGHGLVGYAAAHRHPVLAPDVSRDPRYIMVNPETRSELCVPLLHKGQLIGVLDLEHTRRAYFTEDHVRMMTTLAAQVAIAIKNADLYERLAKEEARMERELAMAREMQIGLFPPCCPTLANLQLAANFVPARAIGGDLYDFLEYAAGRVGIAIGDVSGKGVPAALYAALVSGILRSHAALEPSPAAMLHAINTSLLERKVEPQFVAMIYAVWDDRRRVMQVANSGLPRPIYCHHGRAEIIEATGLPMGLFDDAEYDEFTIHAKAGDVFVFMSDGILDAENLEGELFGRTRVEELVTANCERTADDVVTAIFREMERFSAGTQPFDDATVVVAKVKEGAVEKAVRRKTHA
jgi:sigma-B regulation protein RsbU (phosphoserine phosphatase)